MIGGLIHCPGKLKDQVICCPGKFAVMLTRNFAHFARGNGEREHFNPKLSPAHGPDFRVHEEAKFLYRQLLPSCTSA